MPNFSDGKIWPKIMNWTPLNISVRVGCNLAYETTVQTPV